jgi:glycosyltransferase involved in cell wall biosynthesis
MHSAQKSTDEDRLMASDANVEPLVSAVVTTFRRPEDARRAIISMFAQSYGNLEIIVVEDGSNSALEEWLDQEGVRGARYLRHDTNRGLAAARNSGLATARGEYIAFLDDDDEWKRDRIAKQVQLLRNTPSSERAKLAVVYCRSEQQIGARSLPDRRQLNRGNLKDSIVARGMATVSSSCLFVTQSLRHVGGFDEGLPSSIDHDVWMSLAVAGYHADYVDEALVVTYPRRNRRTMMTDTPRRIDGVRLFVEKWLPVFQEWYGPDAGRSYAERYYATTISRLVTLKLMERNWREAAVATRSMFAVSTERLYNWKLLAGSAARASLGVARLRGPLSERSGGRLL